jgi:hypothetical protein
MGLLIGEAPESHRTRILLPPADSNSITQPGAAVPNGAMSSTNSGCRCVLEMPPSAATSRRFNLPASRCSCWAVRFTPSRRATSMAIDHNSSGIGALPERVVLQSSNRDRALSILLAFSDVFGTLCILKCDDSSRGRSLHALSPETHIGSSKPRPCLGAQGASAHLRAGGDQEEIGCPGSTVLSKKRGFLP